MAKEEAHLIAKGLKGPRRPAVEEEPPLSILGKRFEGIPHIWPFLGLLLRLIVTEIDAPDDLAKRQKFLQEIGDLDADDESDSDSNESNEGGQEQESDNEDSDSDDDDDTAELMRELEKIKRERALEKETAERARIESELASKEEEALVGNPLLATGFAVKKRWDEDVIFKNQAKPGAGSGANAGGKRFINDMLRSDFHRKFMNKYVK